MVRLESRIKFILTQFGRHLNGILRVVLEHWLVLTLVLVDLDVVILNVDPLGLRKIDIVLTISL